MRLVSPRLAAPRFVSSTGMLVTLCLLTLTACGADAPPQAPGVKVEGDVQMGVVIR